MTNSDDSSYYIRIRGKVYGPYNPRQLNSLRKKGQFNATDEFSADRTDWQSASLLDSVFGSQEAPQASFESQFDSLQSHNFGEAATANWYYSLDDQQQGPVTESEMIEMLEMYQLSGSDMVWKEGMPDWIPASEVDEFREYLPAPKVVSTRSIVKRKKERSALSPVGTIPHLFDPGLDAIRQWLNRRNKESTGQVIIEIGRWSMYAIIVIQMIAGCIFSFQSRMFVPAVAIIPCGILLLGLQYVAVKSCFALQQSIMRSKLRLSSTVILDTVAVLAVAAGFWIFSMSILWFFVTNDWAFPPSGVGIFFVLGMIGILLLNPSAMGITVSQNSSTGEDALAIIFFLITLPLRFAPIIFALGSVFSLLGAVGITYFLMSNHGLPSEGLHNEIIAFGMLGQVILVSTLLPPLMYIQFILDCLFIDVVHAILILPEKVELSAQLATARSQPLDDRTTNTVDAY